MVGAFLRHVFRAEYCIGVSCKLMVVCGPKWHDLGALRMGGYNLFPVTLYSHRVHRAGVVGVEGPGLSPSQSASPSGLTIP